MYFRFIPIYRLQPVYIVVMGCKWVCLSVYGLYLQYLTCYVRYGLHIGAILVFTAVTGGILYPVPPPILKRGNLGCLSKKFFYFFIFFIFAFVIEVFKPVGVVSSFAGFFRVNSQKSSIFLMLELVLVGEMRNLAIFR